MPGLRKATPTSTITKAKIAVAPASMTHQRSAVDAAAGPAGSSVESGPAQPERSGRAENALHIPFRRTRRWSAGTGERA